MTPRFFGYGSLVNAATHSYPDARPARLDGWRRVWRHTSLRPAVFLSVEEAEGSAIHGLTADVPGADWTALDIREGAYRRHKVRVTELPGETQIEAQVYAVPEGDEVAGLRHPILLSYLDAVVQGFVRVFGEDGAAGFFETTAGWDIPVRDDRDAPIYPRAQLLETREREIVDHHLRALRCEIVEGETPIGKATAPAP
ncbi:gamma-glutamylcyclotransferase family protein [Tropicimonas sp. IMCC34011]|uniref:gamma-glutamylcyclotransferase family protein n=1 Tax=Tropicimonas sp. IMCC34011 TaxID=2248759 RepID=UPI000E2636CE|nr:gamma-glutamylcyclotransferase family protein [Tropicimonas sp. IMCC34011]